LTNPIFQTMRIDSMEGLRGVAALLIIFYHLVTFANLPTPNELSFIKSYFGMGVPLFFTLSGFVLAWGYSKKLRNNRNEIISFYIRRFFRIAPLFFTVLIFWRTLGHFLWSWTDSNLSIFLNLTFLFGLVPGYHESLVLAGWSIGIEMLFYLIFPFLIYFLQSVLPAIIFWFFACFFSVLMTNYCISTVSESISL